MAKPPKLSIPGSLFVPKKADRIYIKFKGKQYSTGLRPDKQGYALAKMMLEKLYLDYHNLKPKVQAVTFQEAWDLYEQTLVNKSVKTITNYKLSFETIVTAKNEYMTNDKIEQLVLDYLRTTAHNKVSINTNLTQFQVFLNYCAERKFIDKVNYKGKYSLKVAKGTAKSYSIEETQAIIDYFNSTDKEMSLLVQFMVETGARVVDALTLEWQQVNFETARIEWRNKITKLPETRPISEKTISILRVLQNINRSKPFSWQYSSSTSVNKKLRRSLYALNIPQDGRGLQEFRVTFRMQAKRKGMPEDLIEYLLRHSSGKLIHNFYTDYNSLEVEIRKNLNKMVE